MIWFCEFQWLRFKDITFELEKLKKRKKKKNEMWKNGGDKQDIRLIRNLEPIYFSNYVSHLQFLLFLGHPLLHISIFSLYIIYVIVIWNTTYTDLFSNIGAAKIYQLIIPRITSNLAEFSILAKAINLTDVKYSIQSTR